MASENTPTGSQAQPPSPPASFYAMSDEEEDGAYDTVTAPRKRKGVKLLFSKSKVYIHPTRSEKDNVPGYIAFLQQKPQQTPRDHVDVSSNSSSSARSSSAPASSDLLLAWVPDSILGDTEGIYIKIDMAEDDEPPLQTYLVDSPPVVTSHTGGSDSYAFAVPLNAIFSLQVRPPSPGWFYGSIIINSRLGTSFPPLFFHDDECHSTIMQKKRRMRENFDPFGELGELFWGGHEVLRWVRHYVNVERSAAETSVYLIEPTKEDSRAFGADAPIVPQPSDDGIGSPSRLPGRPSPTGPDPFMQFVREAGWNVMEKFSRVTTFTRRAAREVLENPNLPPQVRRLVGTAEVRSVSEEYESARIYLARWALGIAERSERERGGGREWTARDVVALEETGVGEFEVIDGTSTVTLADRRKRVTLAEWKGWFDSESGRLLIRPDEVKERVFHGGLDPDDNVRAEVWLFLLGVYDWDSTADERKAHMASLRDQYYRLKSSWWERLGDGDNSSDDDDGDEWREQRARIEKDVHRTDRNVAIFRGDNVPHPDPDSPFADIGTNVHLEQLKEMLLTYNEYNPSLGYVQGMSDLLAPIYVVVQDDAVAFWAFARFMDRMERNFLRDQTGMRGQLLALDQLVRFMDPRLHRHLESADSTNFFFFFRMLLVWYKREFWFEDVLRLWEALWTDYLCSSFHLFIALAILEKHRNVMMDHLKHFDEVLKYVNELSNTIDLGTTLIRAESLFHRFRRMVEAVDKRANFPAPRTKASIPAQKQAPRDSQGPRSPPGAIEDESADLSTIVTPELRKLLSRKVDWARTENERKIEWEGILAGRKAKKAEEAGRRAEQAVENEEDE